MSSFMQDTFTCFPGMKQKDFHSSFCTFRVQLHFCFVGYFIWTFPFKHVFDSCNRWKQLSLVQKADDGPLWAQQTLCSTCRSWLLPWSLTQKLRREEDSDALRGHSRLLLRSACSLIYNTHSFSFKSFWSCLGKQSVLCTKLRLFTTDWTWTYDCSPVLYHSTSLSVNLLWNSMCKAFGKSTFFSVCFVFKRNIDMFSV